MLRVAASKGLVTVLQWLAKIGAATLEDCRTRDSAPFRAAAVNGHVGALDWFAQHYAALGLTPEEAAAEYQAEQNFIVVLASYNGHVDVLRWLAAHGAVTRDVCQTYDWNGDLQEGALHVAARLPVLKLFADECYPAMGLTARDFIDDCLLHDGCIFSNAADRGGIWTLKWLKTRALAVGMSAEEFAARLLPSSPLRGAIENGYTDVADWLAAHGAAGLDECITALGGDEISTTGLYWLANHGLPRINFDAAGYGDVWLEWMGQQAAARDQRESAAAPGAGLSR